MPDADALDQALQACRGGDVPPAIAAMRLLMAADSEAALRDALAQARSTDGGARPLDEVERLIDAHPGAFERVRALAEAVAHEPARGDPVAHWAALFDRAVQVSPEGSVALYSLGSASVLERATGEIVDWLGASGLLGPDRTVLDVGCGIGRLGLALAPQVAAVIGIDISPGMIDEARRRAAGRANLRFRLGSGRDLAGVDDASVDLVAFVDSFPYLVLSGEALAGALIAEAARVLRPGGAAVVLNASYRSDLNADESDLARMGAVAGLVLTRIEARPFRHWDAPAFVLARDA